MKEFIQDNSILFFVLACIFLILTIVFICLYFKISKTLKDTNGEVKKIIPLTKQYNFEQDTQFLMYIIGYKCKVYTQMVLTPLDNIKAKIINGEELDKAVANITIEIEKYISEDYRKLLYKYFYVSKDKKDDTLTSFIAENVLITMTNVIETKNKKKLNSMRIINKAKDIQNIDIQKTDIDGEEVKKESDKK